jgi:plastocyanin
MNARIAALCLGSALFALGCGDKADDSETGSEVTTSGSTTASGGTTATTTATDGTTPATCGTTHEVTTTDDSSDMEVYMDFSPEDITIAVGDCVRFVMSDTHNAVEVSQDNYDNLIGTALDGGFEVQYGETAEVYFGEAGTHYYVCQPHVRGEMIGTITVE